MSEQRKSSTQLQPADTSIGNYIISQSKGVLAIGLGVVGGWFAGLAVNRVFRRGKGISAEHIEQFAGPFKKQLQGLQEDDVLLYETIGSVAGGTGAAILMGYGGWKRSREQGADIKEIKEKVFENHGMLSRDGPAKSVSDVRSHDTLGKPQGLEHSV